MLGERNVKALVNTGCTTLMTSRLVDLKRKEKYVDGMKVQCKDIGMADLAMCGVRLRVKVIVNSVTFSAVGGPFKISLLLINQE